MRYFVGKVVSYRMHVQSLSKVNVKSDVADHTLCLLGYSFVS